MRITSTVKSAVQLFVGASLLTTAVTSAVAAQTVVTDRSQIVGGSTVSWVNQGSTNPFVLNLGPVNMTVTNLGPNGWLSPCVVGACWDGGFANGDYLLFSSRALGYTFDFSAPMNGFATQAWFDAPTAGTIGVSTFLGGAQTGSFVVATGGGFAVSDNTASVVGFADANGFDRIELRSVGVEPAFAINQLTLSPPVNVVPEPASVLLVGGGLCVLLVGARRRARAASVR